MQAITLITASMRLIGAIGIGETPSASEAADGLAALNLLVDSWSTERPLITAMQLLGPFSLVTTQQSYTIGSGGNFSTTRPIKIEEAKLVLVDPGATATGKLRLPLALINHAEFVALNPRTLSGTTPVMLYNDHQQPLSNLYFWPIPVFATNTPQVELVSWVPVPTFAALTTTVTLAPGYERALKYHLAIELAPEFGRPLDPAVVATAAVARAAIQTLNRQVDQSNEPGPQPPPGLAGSGGPSGASA